MRLRVAAVESTGVAGAGAVCAGVVSRLSRHRCPARYALASCLYLHSRSVQPCLTAIVVILLRLMVLPPLVRRQPYDHKQYQRKKH